eukprot:6205097-Amphidinium_carterae.2
MTFKCAFCTTCAAPPIEAGQCEDENPRPVILAVHPSVAKGSGQGCPAGPVSRRAASLSGAGSPSFPVPAQSVALAHSFVRGGQPRTR